MHIHFIRNKWFCRKKELQNRDMCKSPMKRSSIPEIFDHTQSSFSWNITHYFPFLSQYEIAVLNGIMAVWKAARLTWDVSSSHHPGIWRSCQISFLHVSLPEIFENCLSSSLLPWAVPSDWDFSQSKRLHSTCKSLFTVIIFLLSTWCWPYLPSYTSLSSLVIDIGSLTAKLLCLAPEHRGEKIPWCHLLTFPISVLLGLHLSLCRELWSRSDKWYLRRNSAPQNLPIYLYSVQG